MKTIHECAVIKDGNERVAYMITKTNDCTSKDIIFKPWKIVDSNTFEKMVAENKVQFLVWENNTIKCRYSGDEARALKRSGMNKEFFERSKEDYWSLDMQFKYRHIKAASEHRAFACSVAVIQKTFGVYMIPVYMYGDVVSMEAMMSDLAQLLGVSLSKCFQHNGDTIGRLILPYIYFEKLVGSLSCKYPMLYNTYTAKNIIRDNVKLPTVPLIQGKNDSEKVLKIINKIDRITLDTEKRLGI